jgi:hypothetical protein
MMKKALVILGIWLASASLAHASSGWKVLAHKSASGQFAVTAVSATSSHPHSLAVQFSGHVQTGEGIVACSKGFSVSSNSRSFNHAGLFRLPMTKGADSCNITASVGGSGTVTVRILSQ